MQPIVKKMLQHKDLKMSPKYNNTLSTPETKQTKVS
jgi:hypothetical protein